MAAEALTLHHRGCTACPQRSLCFRLTVPKRWGAVARNQAVMRSVQIIHGVNRIYSCGE